MSCDVSVIIPCYRCVATIERAIDSVTTQALLPRELILVDDASGDGTLTLLNSLADRISNIHVKVISLSVNRGAGVARNAGWDAATGKYIAFLDSDDAWLPQKLKMQIDWMERHPHVGFTCTRSVTVLGSTFLPCEFVLSREALEPIKAIPLSVWKMLVRNSVATRSVVIDRSCMHRFHPEFRRSEDFLLWMQILTSGEKGVKLDMPLAAAFKYGVGVSGLSGSIVAMQRGSWAAGLALLRGRRISPLQYLVHTVCGAVKLMLRFVIFGARRVLALRGTT